MPKKPVVLNIFFFLVKSLHGLTIMDFQLLECLFARNVFESSISKFSFPVKHNLIFKHMFSTLEE